MIRLDLGCGLHKVEGTFGIDKLPLPGCDVLCDLNHYPYPLADNSVDEIYANQILEHLPDLITTMEEICRIGKDGCKVYITVPYWASEGAFRDPTHMHFFTEKSFEYFTPWSECNYYSTARFKQVAVHLIWNTHRWPLRLALLVLPKSLLKVFNNVISSIKFELEVIKDASAQQ